MLDAPFPSDWQRRRLVDVAEVRTGLAKGKKDITDPIRRPYLRVANVQDGHLDLREIKHIAVAAKEVERYTLHAGDILLTEGGDADKLGRGTLWRDEVPACLHQNHIFVVRVHRDQLLPEYLVWLTASPHGREYFRRCSKQSTNLASINSHQLKGYPLVLPGINEQRGIARVLLCADRTIESAQSLLKSRRKLKRGLLQQLLTGHYRFPEFQERRWREVALGDVLKEIKRPVALQPSAQYRLVSIRRRSGGFFDREVRLGGDIGYPVLERIMAGDFVIARRQVLHGAMAIVPPEFDEAFVSNAYAILRPRDESELHLPFFNFISQQQRLYHMAFRCSYGVAIEKMFFRLDWFFKERLHIPPTVDEQKKIVSVLATADEEIERLRHLLHALKEQKKGLMQRLLTGKIRVPPSILKAATTGDPG